MARFEVGEWLLMDGNAFLWVVVLWLFVAHLARRIVNRKRPIPLPAVKVAPSCPGLRLEGVAGLSRSSGGADRPSLSMGNRGHGPPTRPQCAASQLSPPCRGGGLGRPQCMAPEPFKPAGHPTSAGPSCCGDALAPVGGRADDPPHAYGARRTTGIHRFGDRLIWESGSPRAESQ